MDEQTAIQSAYAATSPEWKYGADRITKRYLEGRKRMRDNPSKGYFTSEMLRAFADGCGLESAPEPRCWGQILRQLKAAKLIKAVGWRKTANPKAHSRLCRVWRAL